MTEVWSGDILLPDGTAINDVSLASQNAASMAPIASLHFHFLATVDTARIPLHMAAGPSLDVSTSSENAETWFSSILSTTSVASDATDPSPAREWWAYARAQSPVGILAKVQGEESSVNGPRVTEILFYGTIAAPAHGALPTPPSSSPDHSHVPSETLPELRVHALPLSSDLLYNRPRAEAPPLTPALGASEPPINVEPHFLPPTYTPTQAPSSPKRKRDLFEEAAQARKRARGKGGEGVAAAAARAQESQRPIRHRKSLSKDPKTSPFPDSRPNSAHASTRTTSRPLSRSPSISSDIRPLSRKGAPEGLAKPSTLSQVATVPLQPQEPTTESRNKEALSRVLMAAMRMHGFQQRKKNKSRRGSVAPGAGSEEQLSEEAAAEEAAKDEEYKLIYHQTYKSAAFTLRQHISTKPLHSQPDRLRDVVDRLLTIFCTDPLAQPLPGDTAGDLLATPGREQNLRVPGSAHNGASPFDLPSGATQNAPITKSEGEVHTGSPLSRRKSEKKTMPG